MKRSILAICLLSFVVLAATAPATVPPRTCKTVTVEGKRYQIKADQIRCATAVRHGKRYLRSGTRPRGYKCRRYSRRTKLAFRCEDRPKVIFAIRR